MKKTTKSSPQRLNAWPTNPAQARDRVPGARREAFTTPGEVTSGSRKPRRSGPPSSETSASSRPSEPEPEQERACLELLKEKKPRPVDQRRQR